MRNDLHRIRDGKRYQCKKCLGMFPRDKVLDIENEREVIYFVCKRCFVDKVSNTIQNVAEKEYWG